MDVVHGLLALTLAFLAAAMLPVGGDRGRWLCCTGALVCAVLAAVFAFGLLHT